jgi:hypothetical protein
MYAVAEQPGRATGLTNRDSEREILGRLLNADHLASTWTSATSQDPPRT